MYKINEKIACDNGLSSEQAECAYKAIVSHLLNKVPELENIIDTVFTDTEPENLRKEINKLINLLQYRVMEHLKNIPMPELTYRFRINNVLF
jgi:hypothetical protein